MQISSYNKTEYKRKYNVQKEIAQNVSFKGFSTNLMRSISKAMDNNPILTKYSDKFDVENTLKVIRKYSGFSGDVLKEHIKDNSVINSNIISDGKSIKFRNKRPIRLILDGVLYPVAKIPFYMLYGTTNFLKRFNSVKNSNWMKRFENSSFYDITHSYLKKDDKLNALQGLMELGNLKNPIGAKLREKNFLHNTAKTFDPKYGNYNSVNERALTRIVTGFIPAVFLANDAHNLSILCNNNKKEAEEERKIRFKQETGRVLSNAYIQLITLGALSKYINKSKAWYVGVTIGTVLLTEIYSRLRVGRKIHPISPEEAREINRRERKKTGLTFTLDRSVNSIKVDLNGVNKFSENPKYNKFKNYEFYQDKKTNDNQKSALFGLNTFIKFVTGIIAAGYVVKGIKKLPYKKGEIGDIFKNISKGFDKIYKKITMKSNFLDKKEMETIFEKMKSNGFETIADKYKQVVIEHQKHLFFPQFIKQNVLPHSKLLGDENWQKALNLFADSKKNSKLEKLLRQRKIAHNFEVVKRFLKQNKEDNLLEQINNIKGNAFDDKTYSKLHKLFGKSENAKYKDLFENIYLTDPHSLKQEFLNDLKMKLKKAGMPEQWTKTVEDVNNEVQKMSYYNMGIVKKPIIKDVVDFCKEPFKFVWAAITSPYRYFDKLINCFKVKQPGGLSDVDVVGKALIGLKKKVNLSDEQFKHMFDEKIVRGFNTTTMSKLANSDLSSLAKSASTLATLSFLVTDHYNMVMLKSNGHDEEGASTKGKERFVQEVSRFFWQQLFINLFNNTFSNAYNASLLGASVVNTASTTIGEVCTREAVGLPINAKSKEEILALEHNNLSGNGLKSKFFKFMSKLTGKKSLSERKDNKQNIKK